MTSRAIVRSCVSYMSKKLYVKIKEQDNVAIAVKDIAAGIYDEARLEEFHAYFNEHEDGQASKRVIDIVFKE